MRGSFLGFPIGASEATDCPSGGHSGSVDWPMSCLGERKDGKGDGVPLRPEEFDKRIATLRRDGLRVAQHTHSGGFANQ